MNLPSHRSGFVPAGTRALARTAQCDGTGLIAYATDDGPECWACHGCTACTPTTTGPTPARRAAAVEAAFAAAPDDQEW